MGCTGISNRKTPQKVNLRLDEIERLKEITLTQSNIESDYSVVRKLKEAPNIKFYHVNNKYNSKEFCMKVFKRDKEKEDPNYIQKLSNLRKLSHPNLINTIDIYEDEVNFYFITELPKGKELFETMKAYSNFSERTAGKIFYQIASLMFFFHNRNLFHGFLRPEFMALDYEPRGVNLIHKVISDTDGNFSLLMTELGEITNFSNTYYDELKRVERIGKPYYTAPEILKKKPFNEKIDVFAAGVILYIMLCGKPPFYGVDNNEIKQAICDGEWEFDGTEWKEISSSVKDLISRMLNPNPEKRISSKEILCHTWVVYSKEDESFSNNVITAVNSNLVNFHARDQLQQATMAYICNQISNSTQVKELKKLFKEFDKNGDGVLSYDEFKTGYIAMYGKGLQGMELETIISQIDKDGSGKIEYEEFLTATINNSNIINDQNLRAAFVKFDRDGSGKLSIDELVGIVGTDMDLILELLTKVDKNNDGEISYEEFKTLMSMMVGFKEKQKKTKSKDKDKEKGSKSKDKGKEKEESSKEIKEVDQKIDAKEIKDNFKLKLKGEKEKDTKKKKKKN